MVYVPTSDTFRVLFVVAAGEKVVVAADPACHESLRHWRRVRDTRRFDNEVLVLASSRDRLNLFFPRRETEHGAKKRRQRFASIYAGSERQPGEICVVRVHVAVARLLCRCSVLVLLLVSGVSSTSQSMLFKNGTINTFHLHRFCFEPIYIERYAFSSVGLS